MGGALADVAEFGTTGEFWTSSSDRCRLVLFGLTCREAVSTNNAYVRFYLTPHDSTEPKFYSFLVANLNSQEIERYAFLLK